MKNSHVIEMTPEELEELVKAFADIEESIEKKKKNGVDL